MTVRGFAERLIDHAAAVMPEHRREWAAAMQAEFAALPDGRERLAWAVGCVWASYRERIEPMQVFVKSLVRAAAVLVMVVLFYAMLALLDPTPLSQLEWMKLGRILACLYAVMFATLWVGELAVARFWTAPDKLLKKTLLRTAVLWLWPVGFEFFVLIRASMDPVIHAEFAANFEVLVRRLLIDWTGHFSMYFVVIFVPLLVCELIIARFWHPKAATPA